jgi:ATP-dependent DNA helicase RecQ
VEVREQLHKTLKKYFGYDSFREGQEALITQILNGKDVLGIMPTSGGKSLCYQLPALLLDGMTIVVSPLLSLMKDQVDSLRDMGIAAAYLNSSLDRQELLQLMDDIRYGNIKMLYIAPERIENEYFLSAVRQVNVPLLVVDEAHCISQWGSDFRPSYQGVARLYDLLGKRPVVAAFTATATKEVQEDILFQLRLQQPFQIVTGFDRSNLEFIVEKPADKMRFLLSDLNPNDSSIIYCSTRKNVESVHKKLAQKGFAATLYHAGLPEAERQANQEAFLHDRKPVMVATNAFGMGIDKSNVRTVYHYNMPKNIESYYQEAGRAGRDGEESRVILLFSVQDIIINKLLNSKTNDGEATNKLNKMINYCYTNQCLRAYIQEYFGEVIATQDCQHCSNCLNKAEQKDITEEAQKILSCVVRMRGRYGIQKIISVLQGSKQKGITDYGLDKLKTYGQMSKYSDQALREMIGVLIADEYLQVVGDQYPLVQVTQKALSVLKEGGKVAMSYALEETGDRAAKQTGKGLYDTGLFDRLRQLRMELASEHGIPSYIVFSDVALHDMGRLFPTTAEEFLQVSGVGETKLERYGKPFMELVADYLQEFPEAKKELQQKKREREEQLKDSEGTDSAPARAKRQSTGATYDETYRLYQEGRSLDEIVALRGMSKMTIENHFVYMARNKSHDIRLSDFVTQEQVDTILSVAEEQEGNYLKPIKEALGETYTYFQISLALASQNRS